MSRPAFLSRIELKKLGPLAALLILCIGLAFVSPDFLTLGNLLNVMRQVSINAVIAFGMTLVILLGGIDLSVGSILAMSSVVMALLLKAGGNPALATLLGVLAGACLGTINGLIVTKGKVAPFIATLGTMTTLRGFALVFSNGSPITGFSSDFFSSLGDGYVASLIPVPVVWMLVLFVVFWFVMKQTVFGRHVYATGGNVEAAGLSGVKTDRVQIYVYTICGATAAMSGVILMSRLNSAQPTAGVGYELDAIAAVVIGGTRLSGGQGTIIGTIIGTLIMGVLTNILRLNDIDSNVEMMIKAVIIVLAVAVQRKGRP